MIGTIDGAVAAPEPEADDEAALWAANDAAMLRVASSEDAREGPRAFMEKREPNWSGR